MKKLSQKFLLFTLIMLSVTVSFGVFQPERVKNVLLINSYHQGFAWTDSLTYGISIELKTSKGINLFIENLNSKQFGQSHFESTERIFKEKYSPLPIDGVLLTDNDALDFAFQFGNDLFPNVPVVFAGISNPEEYPLEGSNFWGYKETTNTDSIVDLIRQLLPDLNRLLVITDKTTTGKIYRADFLHNQMRFSGLSIYFPEVIDLDSICTLVSSGTYFEAIFYIGISQDRNGKPVDNVLFLDRIGRLATVPLFSNDPLFIGKGVIGGLYQSGFKQGTGSAQLLVKLMKTPDHDSFQHISVQKLETFFDRQLLDKFNIPVDKLPHGSTIANQKNILNKRNFEVLLIILMALSMIVVFLFVSIQRRKAEQKRSNSQLREIEAQKNKLEATSIQLERVISELESTNSKLNKTNTDLLVAKKKAEESDNLKSAFLANVSHEIRTPLNSIVGFSSLLAEDVVDIEKRKYYNGFIESSSESLLVLIDEIIDLSKIEAQQLTIYKKEFSIDELMTELFHIFTTNNKNPKVELRTSKLLTEKELYIYSDRVRVKQIFTNLLSNAYKFTENSFIEFGYQKTGSNQIQFYVKDSGIGIEEEHYEAVFGRFIKLNDNKSKVYGGTGLGLAITKKLVELLGGKIWIKSEMGKGTTFFFTLSDLEFRDNPNH